MACVLRRARGLLAGGGGEGAVQVVQLLLLLVTLHSCQIRATIWWVTLRVPFIAYSCVNTSSTKREIHNI